MAEEKKHLKKKELGPDMEMIKQLEFLKHMRMLQMVNDLNLLGDKPGGKKGNEKK